MKKKIPIIGIISCIAYFLSVITFLITQSDMALTVWEMFTIEGAVILCFVLVEVSSLMDINTVARRVSFIFMSSTCTLTGLAHIVNITVTRKLIAQGISVPDYYQIGKWPSVEMAVDYLAWGLFMGLVYLTIGLGSHSREKSSLLMKNIFIVCGVLCLVGFFGTLFINENLWYIAPVGYGFGSIIICLQMLRMRK